MPAASQTIESLYRPSGNNGSYNGALPSNYDDTLNANTLARLWQVRTPGGQTAAGVNAGPGTDFASTVANMSGQLPFRDPIQMQDWRAAAGNPMSPAELTNYTKQFNAYYDSQHPGQIGVRGWMRNHPVGVIAAFVAAAAGGAELSGAAAGGGAAGGAGGGAAGGGGAVGGGAAGGGAIGGAAGGGAIGAESALPEIVVTGSAGGGAGALGAAGAAGAVGAGLGSTAGGGASNGANAGNGGGSGSGGGTGTGLQNSSGSGIFDNGGQGGMASAGGGNTGALANSGGISGGAGGGMGTAAGSGSGSWVDTLINVGTDLAGSYLAGDAAHDASRTQAAAAAAAIAEERRQYDQNRADLAPYRAAGSTAIGQLSEGTANGGDFNRDFTLADFQKDPGYQFRMDEGSRAVQGANAATVGVQNGRTLAELSRYGQDYASGEYSNAYNRFNNDRTTRFNRLATVAGVGQTATNTGVASGNATTNSVADLTLDRANAQAAGRIGQANAYGQGLESLANFYRTRKYGGANTNWIGG